LTIFIQTKSTSASGATSSTTNILTDHDIDVVKKVSGVKKVTGFALGNAELKFSDQTKFGIVIGVDLDTADLYFESGAYSMEQGRLLRKGDARDVVIGSQYAHNSFFKKPVGVGDNLLINGVSFKVRGIANSVGNPQDDRNIFMPQDEFRQTFNSSTRVDAIIVQVEDGEDLTTVASRVEKKLMSSRDVNEKTVDFTILSPEELLATFGTILNIITAFLLAVAAISLLVGGIGVANTMFTSVLERTKEIGVMKAIGAKNKEILFIFVIESGLLGFFGGIIGVFVGVVISKTIEYIAVHQIGTTLLKAAIPPYLVIGCLTFSLLIGLLSGLWPAWRAVSVKPVEALRYE